jgi:hypothetical protein
MFETGFLDTLVKLASLGTSGICIFAIFWCGWLLKQPKVNQKNMLVFMGFCVVIALIQLFAGLARNHRASHQAYLVTGTVQKDDGSDPGDVTISTHYPPLVPNGSGQITSLYVEQDADGKLPSLGFRCLGYSDEGINLPDDPKTNVIDVGKITMHKLPK